MRLGKMLSVGEVAEDADGQDPATARPETAEATPAEATPAEATPAGAGANGQVPAVAHADR